MILDNLSHNALETLLGMTFGNNTKHYTVISEEGLNYPLVNDIELNINKTIKDTYFPFSTFISKSVLKNYNLNPVDLVNEGINEVKKLSIFNIFSKLNTNKETMKIKRELSQKCISDELLKSQKLLENKELDNSAILLLLKGIKNLEHPEYIEGLKQSEIQEVGALQIGMSINALTKNTPNLFKFSKEEQDDFSFFINKLKENKFIQTCCSNAKLKEKSILELYFAVDKDKQFDAFINSNNEIDYSTSFSDLSETEKNKRIGLVKREARLSLNSKKFDN